MTLGCVAGVLLASQLHQRIKRAERTPSIVQAEGLARALDTGLSEMFAEVERRSDESDAG